VCETCGCSADAGVRIVVPGRAGDAESNPNRHDRSSSSGHAHTHGHHAADGHEHASADGHTHRQSANAGVVNTGGSDSRTLVLEHNLLQKNDDLAARNREWLAQHGMSALNLMSSPGAGKTSLLERTIEESESGRTMCVIEGDQETLLDADRIKATGASVVQINTGAGCHLDADMLRRGIDVLQPPDHSLLFVENVGNLVCPALFDLGESAKVVIISVTEGDDKPLKYPHMFTAADVIVVNKTDLLPYVDFDLARLERDARSLNPGVSVLAVSVRTGEGLAAWYEWLAAA
jgi:hydrogenase nickel incorporation protein HypB